MPRLQCRACLVFCMDFRLHNQLRDFLASENLDRDGVDIVRVAGASRCLARPGDPSEREFMLRQLRIAAVRHGIREIYLINHEDCGAYGPDNITDSDEELMVHSRDLRAARAMLNEEFPEIDVIADFMWLDGGVKRVD